jgi:CrcB protein
VTLLGLALAGALGALTRYGVSIATLRWMGLGFPRGTLLVNLTGCFLLGFVTEAALGHPEIADRTRAIVGTGFLGAFTTFSTFGVETLRALEAGQWVVAAASVGVNVVAGIGLAALGMALARGVDSDSHRDFSCKAGVRSPQSKLGRLSSAVAGCGISLRHPAYTSRVSSSLLCHSVNVSFMDTAPFRYKGDPS